MSDQIAAQSAGGTPSIVPQQGKGDRRLTFAELLGVANGLHRQGELAQAESLYRLILERQPENANALHMLGMIAFDTKRYRNALELVSKAAEILPEDHRIQNNLGNIFRELGEAESAVQAYKRAIELDEDYLMARFNLALPLQELRRYEEAEESLKYVVDRDPRNAQAHFELGEVFRKQRKRTEAQIAYRVTLDIDPTHEKARYFLADIIASLGAYGAAIDEFQIALGSNPEDVKVLNGLGAAYKKRGQLTEALNHLNKAFDLNDLNTETLHNLATVYQTIGENETAADYHKHLLELAPHAEFSEKTYLFLLLNRPDFDPEKRFNIHRALRSRHDREDVRGKTFPTRSRNPEKKLRIGYLSSDFRTHVVALNLLPVIAHHDHDQFDIQLYYQFKGEDRVTKSFRQLADGFTIFTEESNQEVAKTIEQDEVDILVLMAGRFDENRPLVSTYRPAPVQVSFHDCATSGLEAMDYWFTDELLHPQNTQELFTEELYRLPVYYQYVVQDGVHPPNQPPVIQNGYVTFGCFNKPEKINEDVVRLWARVLTAVPGSKLYLKYFNHYSDSFMRERMINLFAQAGIKEHQLQFKAANDIRQDHLMHYHDVDISLDPFPFNGATTTYESLTMGVPVICLWGENFVDRVAGSIVTHAGFPELAAGSTEEYVRIAVELAGDMDALRQRRLTTRDQLYSSPICSGSAYTRTIEAAYRDIWRRWCGS